MPGSRVADGSGQHRDEHRDAAPSPADAAERYHRRRDRAVAERDDIARRASTTSNLRLFAFAAGIAALVWAELRPEVGAVALVAFGLAALAFVVLIGVHSRLEQRRRLAAAMAEINDEAAARLRREWAALPANSGIGDPPPGHAYARDLDILGHGSVAQLVGTAGTGAGRARLRRWLLAAAPHEEAAARQEAVRELVPKLDFRQELHVLGRLAGDPDRHALDAFLGWAEEEPWLLRSPVVVWLGRLIPVATFALLALHIDGALDRPWWLFTLVAGMVLAGFLKKRTHATFDRASLGDSSLRHYADLVRRIQEETFEATTLRRTRDALTTGTDARRQLERLGWLTELADLRHNGMFHAIIHYPTLWDLHVLWGLERWQRQAGREVREWVDRTADLDALCALAGPALDETGWSFPELAASGDILHARGLAHPLLTADERVPNDVDVGPPGTFLMVTGSNMSGKSTLLRSLGVNVVLARAGGPVCAERLVVPPLTVFTSMRIEDSLERGVSLFMAELQRLKRVVDAADEATGDGRPTLLYLLDEILHGTNSAERQVAVREVVSHLLRRRAVGAISTHDLELAVADPLASAVVPVHFRETVHPDGHEPPMTFDYILRDGIATSTNALKLVRLVGLA